MNAPQDRIIAIDITYLDELKNKMHTASFQVSLDDEEEFVGIAFLTAKEKEDIRKRVKIIH